MTAIAKIDDGRPGTGRLSFVHERHQSDPARTSVMASRPCGSGRNSSFRVAEMEPGRPVFRLQEVDLPIVIGRDVLAGRYREHSGTMSLVCGGGRSDDAYDDLGADEEAG
jgi:hypothetical protein